jgi:hypothetical protein
MFIECVEVEFMWLEMEGNEHTGLVGLGTIVVWIEKIGKRSHIRENTLFSSVYIS